jgi:hypothetical protein
MPRQVTPGAISGYLGKNAQFDEAIGKFALAYADQAERDHAALKAAVRQASSRCNWSTEQPVACGVPEGG